jgi:DNA polymerase III delta prime subunit
MPDPEDLTELQELMERAGVGDRRMKQLLTVAAVDPDAYTDFLEIYQQKVAQVVDKDIFYPYPDVRGRFRVGTDPDGTPVGVSAEGLNEHLLVVGRTGVGKTTVFYNLLDALTGEQVPWLVFDFKSDYRHLARHRDILVINWRDLKFNPLQPPPGVAVGQWGEVLADTVAHSLGFLQGSQGYLLNKLNELYGYYPTDDGVYPSLFELLELVKDDSFPMASPRFKYQERMINRLAMLTGFSGQIFECSSGFPIEALLDRNVVLELKEPNQYTTNLAIETILTYIFYYRDAMGQRGRLRHAVLFDEAKRVFDRNREQDAASFSPADELSAQVREFGESLIVADQEPSKLSDSIKANTYAKLWMSLSSGHDTGEMRQTFGLDAEETDFTRTMGKGEGLFKLADSEPVPVELPDYRLDKSMTEDEIRELMAAEIGELDWAERQRPDPFTAVVGEEVSEPTAEDEGLSEAAEALLVNVNETPFAGMTERYDDLSLSSEQGTGAKAELLDRELVRETSVSTGKPGRNPTFLELTDAGKGVLEDHGIDVSPEGMGGPEHRYWQQQIREFYAVDGYDVEIEYGLSDGSIDVYANDGDEAIACEVARSAEHEVANIKKCLREEPDRIRVVYIDAEVKNRIQSQLTEELGFVPDRVEFAPVSAFT